MTTIRAVFKGGVFCPKEPVHLEEGAEAEVVLPDDPYDPVEHFRRRFPNSVGILPKEDADELERIINEEFSRIDPEMCRDPE